MPGSRTRAKGSKIPDMLMLTVSNRQFHSKTRAAFCQNLFLV